MNAWDARSPTNLAMASPMSFAPGGRQKRETFLLFRLRLVAHVLQIPSAPPPPPLPYHIIHRELHLHTQIGCGSTSEMSKIPPEHKINRVGATGFANLRHWFRRQFNTCGRPILAFGVVLDAPGESKPECDWPRLSYERFGSIAVC